jgi:hypothetical protein
MLYTIAKPAHIYGEGTVERIKVAPAGHLQITHRSRAIKFNVGISLDARWSQRSNRVCLLPGPSTVWSWLVAL